MHLHSSFRLTGLKAALAAFALLLCSAAAGAACPAPCAPTASANALLHRADALFCRGEYASALTLYNRIRNNAFSGDVKEGMLYHKAVAMIKTGYYDEAAPLLRTVAGSRRYGTDARFYLAYIDYAAGRYDEAYRGFTDVQRQWPGATQAEYFIMQLDYLKGDYAKVARTAERLLSAGETPLELRPEAIRVGAISFFKTGDKTTARNMLRRYVDITGDGAEISALYTLATIYYDEGNYSEALPLFATVAEFPGPLAQSSWLYIGQIHVAEGDPRAAGAAFDKAARESWDSGVAETGAYNLAVASASGPTLPFSDAAAAMERFISAYPSSPYAPSLSSYLANAYYGQRDYENALRYADLIPNPDAEAKLMRQKILYQLGLTRLRQGRLSAAMENLQLAAAPSAPDREVAAQASLWLGEVLYIRKDYSGAERAYRTALDSGLLGANTATGWYDLGYALLKLRNYAKAQSAFKHAIDLGTLSGQQLTDARLRYADCLYYNGHYSEALTAFRNIKLEGGPTGVFAAVREADILGRNGDVGQKITLLESLVDRQDAGPWHSLVLSRLADAYSENGDDRKAAALYAAMLDSSEGSSDADTQAYYSLAQNADNLFKAGDYEEALKIYRRVANSGIDALYPEAVTGIMRTSADPSEVSEYAALVAALPGLDSDALNEALFLGSEAGLKLGGRHKEEAMESLRSLSRSADRLWGARAGATLGLQLLADGNMPEAEETLLYLIDTGSDSPYWLARGYIALSDVYASTGKDYLARLYLETLRANYPGSEREINDMIDQRLKLLDK